MQLKIIQKKILTFQHKYSHNIQKNLDVKRNKQQKMTQYKQQKEKEITLLKYNKNNKHKKIQIKPPVTVL